MDFKSAKVLIATIGLCLGSAAIAQDLVYIYTDESTGAVWYYDAETIRRNSQNRVEFWTEMDASKDKTVSFRTFKTKMRIDCSAETYGVLAAYKYRADGTVIDSESRLTTDMAPIVPGTFGQKLFTIMCP